MASIIKIIKLSKQLPIKPVNPLFISSVRTAVSVRDYQPGPYPKTKEERIKAARKYNLHPDEYVPFPEHNEYGEGRGDYPDLPLIGHAGKDPYYPWDIPEDRRNYMEPIPEDFDDLGADRLDYIGTRQRYTNTQAAFTFLGSIGFFFLLYLIGEQFKYFRCVTDKQYPQPGVKHYTFEPATK